MCCARYQPCSQSWLGCLWKKNPTQSHQRSRPDFSWSQSSNCNWLSIDIEYHRTHSSWRNSLGSCADPFISQKSSLQLTNQATARQCYCWCAWSLSQGRTCSWSEHSMVINPQLTRAILWTQKSNQVSLWWKPSLIRVQPHGEGVGSSGQHCPIPSSACCRYQINWRIKISYFLRGNAWLPMDSPTSWSCKFLFFSL